MPVRILIIEDNKENLELMSYLLGAYGHTVLKAMDGEAGLDTARREIPDLIVCDLQMPKVDGYGVARQLRGDPRLSKIPLVAVTAFAMRGDRDKVMAAGFDGYIAKPIIPEEFVSQVEQFLRPDQHSRVRPTPTDPVQLEPTRDQHRATILVVDNSPVNISLMRSTLEPFGYKVLAGGSVEEGLALARRSSPDLILSDLHMPVEDGYDFLKALKADPHVSAIPFVQISSTVWRETDPAAALALGAARFVFRPIEPQELVNEIESCLAMRKGD